VLERVAQLLTVDHVLLLLDTYFSRCSVLYVTRQHIYHFVIYIDYSIIFLSTVI